MRAWIRFVDWPLRTKLVVLLVIASLLPLGVVTWISLRNARQVQLTSSSDLLAARADELVGRIDTFNRGYQRAVNRMALIPSALALLQATPSEAARIAPTLRAQLQVWPVTDPGIRGVAVLDASGKVIVGTEERLFGVSLAYRSFVQQALRGAPVISDVFLDLPDVGGTQTIAFLHPMRGPADQILGVAAFWVRASALTELLKQSNELAGPGSFAILFDHLGIRIAHSFLEEIVFHPGLPLAPQTIDALVAEQRFGDRTRALLTDVRAVSADFALNSDAPPARAAFRGYAPGNGQWNYVVGRRCATVGWTAYYLVPESVLHTVVRSIVQQRLLFAAGIALAAILVAVLFAAMIVRPVRQLSTSVRTLGAGDLAARVSIQQKDELGELGTAFNAMAERLQQQTEALKRESEAQYRQLFETMNEGFCTMDIVFDDHDRAVDMRVIDVNRAFAGQSGLENAQGRLMSELVPDLEDEWLQRYGHVARTGEAIDMERESPRLERVFSLRAYRIGGDESRRVAILFNDITERRDARRRLEAQLERLNLLQQITRAIGERHDMASIYQEVVRTLEERLPLDFGCIFTYEALDEQLTVACVGLKSQGLSVQMGLTEQARVAVDGNGLSRCVRGELVCEPNVSSVHFPFPQRLAQGGLRSMVAAPLLVESKVFGVLIAARREPESFSSGDCEFLKQLSEHVALAAHQAQLHGALQTAYDELRQTQQAAMQQERLRALGQMSSGIAHDINNAMSPAALYADSLLERETALTAAGREKLETIQRAIHDVAATVARMREFYRTREPQLELVPVQLNELVQQVLHLTRARWSDMPQQRGITIEQRLELQPELPSVLGVESEIREALTNLVFNAVDAMPEGGTLTLRSRRAADRVLVEVIDTGVGMDEDARRRCLEPFFTTKGERGTGLGLAMVYGVLQRHGAGIEIDSAVGAGTTMRLSFAVATAATGTTLPPAPAVPTALRVLVVDDDPVLLRSLREALEADGHKVTIANGGQEGVDLFQAAAQRGPAFNVVLTDLGMPYVDGRQVAAAVKQAAPSTPVIMLTGWGQRLVADGEIPPDVDLVLSKPPKLRDLRQGLARSCPPPKT
ncbi:MAG TPA: ATP-binding protein [Steroidobacteraceae bacterium]|nr:ATP-binding protein [Steroidobacteraceae bacterium]